MPNTNTNSGAKLFENDAQRGCRYALLREIWVAQATVVRTGTHKDQRDQSAGSTHRSTA